ncbi:MAG: IS30 family transposase [Candidatus Anammoxibacter sp.]
MKIYTQLTFEERCIISALYNENYSKKEISQRLKRSRSTIYRELKRNTGLRGYRPKQADDKAQRRLKVARKPVKFTIAIIKVVSKKIKENWSPEQISGWLKRININISHERIYQYILEEKRNGGILYKCLRRSNRKRKKRYGSPDKRGQIPNRVSIDERPAVVNNKTRIGDWEGDTIIGRNHKGAIVTLVERKSKYTLMRKVTAKTSLAVNTAILSSVKNIKEQFKTLTVDNGSEFAKHLELKSKLDVDIYFAHPYHSWERGLNENTNGLIRQYFPKKTDLRNISNNQVLHVQHLINNRPRKSLRFYTPNEIFNHFNSLN